MCRNSFFPSVKFLDPYSFAQNSVGPLSSFHASTGLLSALKPCPANTLPLLRFPVILPSAGHSSSLALLFRLRLNFVIEHTPTLQHQHVAAPVSTSQLSTIRTAFAHFLSEFSKPAVLPSTKMTRNPGESPSKRRRRPDRRLNQTWATEQSRRPSREG